MPVPRKQAEAHRALELLEEYHERLNQPQDKELRGAIERVITIFKSSLFQALLDIQEFYEETLANERKSIDQKTFETEQMAAKWQSNPPLTRPTKPFQDTPSSNIPFADGNATNGHSEPKRYVAPSYQPPPAVVNGSGSEERWETEDIVLEKGHTGLGFSIAGGQDNPHYGDDPSIFVTKIIAGGAAQLDGRLRKDDIILRVNVTDTVNVPHYVAVDALKQAGNIVRLKVKREGSASPALGPPPPVPKETTPQQNYAPQSYTPPSVQQQSYTPPSVQQQTYTPPQMAPPVQQPSYAPPPTTPTAVTYQAPAPVAQKDAVNRIELFRGTRGLGFSIAGGVSNEHVPGDTGIYVTKIIEGGAAESDGRLQVGDKLLAVGAMSLENVRHEDAVNVLKTAPQRVILTFIKNPHPEFLNMSQEYNEPQQQQQQQPFSYTQPPSHQHVPPPGAVPTPYVQAQPPQQQQYAPPPKTPLAQPELFEPVQMPPTPSGVVQRTPRHIQLAKGPQGLGFNIVGGEDGEGIFISYILPGGVADVCGAVFRGDQLLEVNNVNLRGASHEEAALALKNSGQLVTLHCQYRPEDYERFEARIDQLRNDMISAGQMQQPSPRRELYVRALFDYDPSKDSGLPSRGLAFNYGDILHVTNASDDEWWQARRVLADGMEEGYGIVPSKKRVEKKERARRKQVNFGSLGRSTGSLDGRRGSKSQLSFSRKFPFMKSKERLNEETDERPEDMVLSYEAVEQRSLDHVRPVIVLGPLKERLNDDLVMHFPDKYGSCVPHTSRPPRPTEMHGRDYHFVSREQMEEDIRQHQFIEAGQFNNNLYGTSIASVRQVASQGKHCILDVSGNAIRRLQSANLYPIALFVKPFSFTQLMEWNRRLNDEEAQRQFVKAQMLEQEFAENFTAIIQGDTPEDIYAKVKMVIQEQSRPVVWVPSRQPLL